MTTTNEHTERAELIKGLRDLAEIDFDNLFMRAAAMLEAQRPALKPLTDEKAEALIEDLSEWSRYVDADHAHQTLEKHVRDVLEKHGIKEKQ